MVEKAWGEKKDKEKQVVEKKKNIPKKVEWVNFLKLYVISPSMCTK